MIKVNLREYSDFLGKVAYDKMEKTKCYVGNGKAIEESCVYYCGNNVIAKHYVNEHREYECFIENKNPLDIST